MAAVENGEALTLFASIPNPGGRLLNLGEGLMTHLGAFLWYLDLIFSRLPSLELLTLLGFSVGSFTETP